MKVLCIDDKPRSYRTPFTWQIKEGEYYTVCDEFEGVGGIMCYSLEEDPQSHLAGWAQDRFIQTSNIDETEFERNYNKELQPK